MQQQFIVAFRQLKLGAFNICHYNTINNLMNVERGYYAHPKAEAQVNEDSANDDALDWMTLCVAFHGLGHARREYHHDGARRALGIEIMPPRAK